MKSEDQHACEVANGVCADGQCWLSYDGVAVLVYRERAFAREPLEARVRELEVAAKLAEAYLAKHCNLLTRTEAMLSGTASINTVAVPVSEPAVALEALRRALSSERK